MRTRLSLTALEDRDTPSAAVVFPAERLAALGLDPSRVAALTLQLSDTGAVVPVPVSFGPANLSAPGEVSGEPLQTVLDGEPVQAQVAEAQAEEAPAQQPVDFSRPVTAPTSRLNPFVNPSRVAALTFVPDGNGGQRLVPVNFAPAGAPAPTQPDEPEQTVGTQNTVLSQADESAPARTPGATFFDEAAGRWRVAGGVSIGLAPGDDGIARPIVVD